MSEGVVRSMLPLVLEHVGFEAGGRRIIDDVSVTISGRRNTVILGPNGAGKSVLMRLCHGLIAPSRGSIRWVGAAAVDAATLRRRQAMVFQKPVLLRRSALGNIVYALALAGLPRGSAKARALQALDRVGLLGSAAEPARALSGGEQQRLAIARAWALEPEVLFLDEPTASLDPSAADEIERLIGAVGQSGTKIVMTTHQLSLAARIADDIVFLQRGRIVEHAPASEFFRAPQSAEAAAFIRAELPWTAARPSPTG